MNIPTSDKSITALLVIDPYKKDATTDYSDEWHHIGGSGRSSKRILGQLKLIRNQIAADCELRDHRYPKRLHHNDGE